MKIEIEVKREQHRTIIMGGGYHNIAGFTYGTDGEDVFLGGKRGDYKFSLGAVIEEIAKNLPEPTP